MTAYMIKCCSSFEKNDMVDSNDLGMQNILDNLLHPRWYEGSLLGRLDFYK